ncbi:MAG: hypothetical protein M3357_07525 [Actinomycetota bacterium]|nr:hypothetical protein [Actinomycetota bacterium]
MRPLVVLACLAVAAGACRGDGNGDGTTSGSTSVSQGRTPAADFTAVGDEYSFDLPDEVPGGVVTMSFENRGELRHEAGIVATGATPVEQVIEDLAPVLDGRGTPIPDYLTFYGGVGETGPRTTSTSTLTLPEGTFVMFCSLSDIDSVDALPRPGPQLPPHYNSGMTRAFTVRRANVDTLPAGDGTVLATDYAFEVPAVTAGRKTLLFRNAGAQMHFGAFLAFPEGVDEAAARQALATVLAAPGGPRPVGVPEPRDAAYAGPFPPRAGGTFEIELESGLTYAVVCFLPDRAGGPPHVAKGMLSVFSVP